MRDWDKTVISQYTSSPILVQLLQDINTWIDPAANLDNFFQLIWNIDTAQGYGLDVWGRIVGINRTLNVGAGSYFGFGEAGDRTGFNQSPFYNGQPTTFAFQLTDNSFRQLILAKAAANITDCSIPAINKILMTLFADRGNAYVTDGANIAFPGFFGFGEAGDRASFGHGPFIDNYAPSLPHIMTMTYTFNFALTPVEIAIVNSGVLPRPTGVLSGIQINVAGPPVPPPAPKPPTPFMGIETQPHFIGKFIAPSQYIQIRGRGLGLGLASGSL